MSPHRSRDTLSSGLPADANSSYLLATAPLSQPFPSLVRALLSPVGFEIKRQDDKEDEAKEAHQEGVL